MVRGVKFGEYRCDKDDDLAMIAAQQYYVEFNIDIQADRMRTLVPQYIPEHYIQGGDAEIELWAQNIAAALRRSYYYKQKSQAIRVKEDMVAYAKYKWPLLFSRFYESIKVRA